MARIAPVDREQLDDVTRVVLESRAGVYKQRWNVIEATANSPSTLQGLLALSESFDDSLSPREQEVIAMEIARHNGCGYCLPAHRYLSDHYGMDKADIDAVTRGELLEHNPELSIIQKFVRAVMATKGKLNDDEFKDFQDSGMDSKKMITIVSEIALYTFYNYFNRLAETEIEDVVLPFVSDEAAWVTAP